MKPRILIDLDGYVVVHDAPDQKAQEFFDYESGGEGDVIHARRKSDGALVGRLWLIGESVEDEPEGDPDDEFYEPPSMPLECIEGYHRLRRKHRGITGALRVRWAEIVERGERRKGLGAALYVGAAMVAKKHRAVLISDDCYGSQTSPEAARVWAGRTLAKYCDVENHTVAYFVGERSLQAAKGTPLRP